MKCLAPTGWAGRLLASNWLTDDGVSSIGRHAYLSVTAQPHPDLTLNAPNLGEAAVQAGGAG